MAAEDRRCCRDPFTVAPRLGRRSRTSVSRLELVERRDQARSRGKAVLGSPFGPRGRPLHPAVSSYDACSPPDHPILNTGSRSERRMLVRARTALLDERSAGMSFLQVPVSSRRGSSHALVPWKREQAGNAYGPSGGHALSGCSKRFCSRTERHVGPASDRRSGTLLWCMYVSACHTNHWQWQADEDTRPTLHRAAKPFLI